MNAAAEVVVPVPGTPFGGGFAVEQIRVGEEVFLLIVAPKADGEHDDTPWNKSRKSVEGALSYFDGRANTLAMAEAGSKLAKWALGLRIADHDDWYLPSQDELELIYRHLKPTADKNWCYARSGINLSSVPPQYPYTPDFPRQTEVGAFRSGGAEAFEEAWYWSSTQHASGAGSAWGQGFTFGGQGLSHEGYSHRARAVRRVKL